LSIELRRKPTPEEIEEICVAAQEAARLHLLSKVSLKRVSDLDVTVEAEGDKPLVLYVDVAVELEDGNDDVEPFVDEATDSAFSAAEAKAKELNLCLDTPA
jgi:predicted nucleotidyltransferase